MSDYLVKVFNVCKINGKLHIYDNGMYKADRDIIYGYMLRLVPTLSDAQRREVYLYTKANLNTPTREVSPPNLIPFKSRIYDIATDRFLDYSPDHVFLNRFPYDYDPQAEPVQIVSDTINAIANGDKDVTDLIYECFGNCFYLLNQYRGSVFLYGQSGNNGKSTLLNMLVQLVGHGNCSFLTVQDMAQKFRTYEMYGKTANICDDNGDAPLSDSSIFKRISTGGEITAEQKGQDPVTFKPYTKCFFALNSLPAVSDKSKAFFSRVLLIPLNADFSRVGVRDVQLKDRVWTDAEMLYLTRLAMDGLKRLQRNGDFTRPQCVKDALRQYEIDNDPVLQFIEETEAIYKEDNPGKDRRGAFVGKAVKTVYQQYQEWCMENGHKYPVSCNMFSRRLNLARGITSKAERDKTLDVTKKVYCLENG